MSRSEEEGPDVRGDEGEVEELLGKSKSRELKDSLANSVTCSTLATAPTENSLLAQTRLIFLLS